MRLRSSAAYRRGSTLLEGAFVYPILSFFLLALVVGGMGMFRYQEVAWLAREGSRYAAVHGAKYQQVTGKPAAKASDVYNNAILPKVVGLDTSQLKYQVTWNPDNQPGSTVTVTVTYNWVPEALVGSVNLTSTSVVQMCY